MAGGLYSLALAARPTFFPGQWLPLAARPEGTPRLYSIASASGAPVEILFDVVAGGELTPVLARVSPGRTLWAGAPAGGFRDVDGPAVWIAAGTGIAPFLSMARSGRLGERRLVHGSRTVAGLLYRAELGALLGDGYLPCCSGEEANGVFAGRITRYLRDMRLDAGEHYLVCGSAELVVDVRDLLIARGVPFERILAEIYI